MTRIRTRIIAPSMSPPQKYSPPFSFDKKKAEKNVAKYIDMVAISCSFDVGFSVL